VFLLPGCQTFDKTEYRSKVLMLFDVSGSMVNTIDDLPEPGQDPAKLPTRQDKVIHFVTEGNKSKETKPFADLVLAKSPATAFRFGTSLDESEILSWKEGAGPESEKLSPWLKPDRKHFVETDDKLTEEQRLARRTKYNDI